MTSSGQEWKEEPNENRSSCEKLSVDTEMSCELRTGEELTKHEKSVESELEISSGEETPKNIVEESEKYLKREVDMHHRVADKLRENAGCDTSKSRLQLLLDQSESYTSFILARSLNPIKYSSEDEQTERTGESATKRRKSTNHDHCMSKEDDIELSRETEEEIYGYRPHTRLQVQPSCIQNGELKPYQLEGLNWLINLYEGGLNGILADEMGLGKTFQSISLLAYLREYRDIKGLHLVLSPKSTLGNWMNEISRFCPSIIAVKFLGNGQERSDLMDNELKSIDERDLDHGTCDVIVTSYEMLLKERTWFLKRNFHSVIIDEAHRIKNANSKLSQTVRQLTTRFRLLLTGTPLQNSLRELWSLLNFLYPEIFSSSEEFEALFEAQTGEEEQAIIGRFHRILRPFMLRRVKSEVEIDIPPKKEILLYVPLTNMQRRLYKDLLSKNVDALQEEGGGKLRLINLAMQLRKACNHPYLFDGYEDKSVDPFGEHVVENSGKMVLMDRLIKKLISGGSRILIFSQMARVLDILEDYCHMRGFPYCRIDGNTSGDDRDRQISEFNRPDSEKLVFLLSTRAGGLGINLATADIVILYDSDWNPQADLQAMDRAHRIGQKKPVFVFRLCHEHTIEEKIIERANLKLQLDFAIIQQGRLKGQGSAHNAGLEGSALSKNELMTMIQYGANEILKTTNVNITEEDIEAIISGGEKKTESLQMKIQKHIQGSLMNFSLNGSQSGGKGDSEKIINTGGATNTNSLYEFEGIDYNEVQRQQDRLAWGKISIERIDQEREERRRGRLENYTLKLIQKYINRQNSARGLDKLPPMHDWQFYDKKRILDLHKRESKYMGELHAGLVRLSQTSTVPFIDENSLLIPVEDVPMDKQIEDISAEEKEEKKSLLQKGFKFWTRREFNLLLRCLETHGVDNLDKVEQVFPNKDKGEIRDYVETLLSRGPHELADWNRYFKRIQSSKEDQKKRDELNAVIRDQISVLKDPWRDLDLESLNIYSKQAKNMTFNQLEDRYLINYTFQYGYGSWDQILSAIKNDHVFSFDWFIKTRSPNDIYRRVDFLIKAFKKRDLINANSGVNASSSLASSGTDANTQGYQASM